MANHPPAVPWPQAIVTLSRTMVGVVIVVALYWARGVLIPIALATLLTILLNPIVRWLQRRGCGRIVSVFLVVSLSSIALTAVTAVGSRQITTLLAELPQHTEKITAKLRSMKALASRPAAKQFEKMIEEISHELHGAPKTESESVESGSESPSQVVERIVLASESMPWMKLTGPLGSAVELIATMAFTFVLLVFFLLEREGLRDRIVLLAGKSRLTLTSKVLEDATARVSRYIMMVEIVNGGFGLALCIGLWFLGVPYPVLWGCVAALLRFLPYIGPWIGAVFPITMSLAMSDGWFQPLAVFGFVMALELVTNNAIEPILFGHTTGVAPTALLISAAFWLFIWGPVGLVMSAPFAVSLVVIGKNISQFRFLNILLGDQPALSNEISFYQRLLTDDAPQARAVIAQRMRNSEPELVFDELIVPALNYAKRDIRRGHITDEDATSLIQVVRDVVSTTELSPAIKSENPDDLTAAEVKDNHKRLTVVGCSADGELDRIALEMLQKLLDHDRWELEIAVEGTLTSELVDQISKSPPAVIFISALPPGGIAHTRYLCKKLRAANVEAPMIIGRWGSRPIDPTDRERLMEVGASAVMTTFLEARKWLNARHLFLDPQTVTTNAAAVAAESDRQRPKTNTATASTVAAETV